MGVKNTKVSAVERIKLDLEINPRIKRRRGNHFTFLANILIVNQYQ